MLTLSTGVAWACAALCTPRTYPFFAAVAVGGALIWSRRRPQRPIVLVWALALATVAVALACSLVIDRITPREWLGLLLTSVTTDQFNGTLSTTGRVWGISAKTTLIPVAALVTFVWMWILTASRNAARLAPIASATVLVTVLHAVLYAIVFNYTFFAGMYFSMPLLAPPLPFPAARRRAGQGEPAWSPGGWPSEPSASSSVRRSSWKSSKAGRHAIQCPWSSS